MNQFKIEKARSEQMPEVAKVFKASRLESLPYLPNLHSEEEDIFFFSNVVFQDHEIYVAIEDQNIIGFIAFNSEWIDHLYLLPRVQNKGVGSQLLNIALKNSTCLKLWTFQKNQSAQKFYEKHGFIELKRTDGTENEEKEPDILMEWRK